ncbi:MAG: uL15 family ribosomal protein [archaeon]
MISKTQISKRATRKRNIEIVESINLAKKNNLLDLAKKLSAPKSQYKSVNLDVLDKFEDDKVLVIGKVLGSGDINKKISVSAFGFSEQAKEKLKKAGCEIKSIKEEISKNKDLKGVKIIG